MNSTEQTSKIIVSISKQKILFLFVLLLGILFAIGESYAYFKTEILGERTYSMKVSNLTLQLDESSTTSNLTLENASALSDQEGLLQDAYTFTLQNQNSFEVGFALFLDDAKIENEINRIHDDKIRYQFIKDGTETIGTLSDLGKNPIRLLDIGKMAAGAIHSYSLRFWIMEGTGKEIQGQELSVKLRVVATQPEVIDTGKIEEGSSMIVTEEGTIQLTVKELNNLIEQQVENHVELALDEKMNDIPTKFSNQFYPVGSIYTSIESTNPSELFGGVWEAYAQGKTLVGVDPNQEAFNKVDATGGNREVTLRVENVPAHTHTVPALSGATSEVETAAHTVTAKGSVTSTFTGSSATTQSAGSHTHSFSSGGRALIINSNVGDTSLPNTTGYLYMANGGWYFNWHKSVGAIVANGDHSHTVTAKGTVASTFTGSSATTSTSGEHAHTVTIDASTTASTGIGAAISVQDPYITVYMWKRVK